MPKHKKEYITVEGVVHQYNYHYLASEVNKRPKCGCGRTLQKIFHMSKNNRKQVGWFCRFCKTVLISNKYKVLKYRQEENNEINSRIRC